MSGLGESEGAVTGDEALAATTAAMALLSGRGKEREGGGEGDAGAEGSGSRSGCRFITDMRLVWFSRAAARRARGVDSFTRVGPNKKEKSSIVLPGGIGTGRLGRIDGERAAAAMTSSIALLLDGLVPSFSPDCSSCAARPCRCSPSSSGWLSAFFGATGSGRDMGGEVDNNGCFAGGRLTGTDCTRVGGTDVMANTALAMRPFSRKTQTRKVPMGFAAVMLAGVAVVGVAVWMAWGQKPVEPSVAVKTVSVAVVSWSEDRAFLRDLLLAREPVIVRKAPVTPAWTFDHVKRRVQVAKSVMSPLDGGSTFFYYDTRHALTQQGQCESRLHYLVRDVPMQQLADDIEAGRGLHYHSTLLNETSAELAASFDASPFRNVSGSEPQVNFWMASDGAVSRMHYDAAHNLFLQVRGRKRFLLIKPSDAVAHRVPMYPSSHPCHRASPIDPTAFLLSSAPEMANVVAQEALLEAGDLLYLPPFWLHHVITTAPSMSVNVYLPSAESVNAGRIYRVPLPISNDWSVAAKLSALNYVLRKTCSLVLEKEGGVEWVRKELLSRYSRLRDDSLLNCKWSESGMSGAEFAAHYCVDARMALTDEVHRELETSAERLAALFERLPKGVRELALADWAEERTLWAVRLEHMKEYLRKCFETIA